MHYLPNGVSYCLVWLFAFQIYTICSSTPRSSPKLFLLLLLLPLLPSLLSNALGNTCDLILTGVLKPLRFTHHRCLGVKSFAFPCYFSLLWCKLREIEILSYSVLILWATEDIQFSDKCDQVIEQNILYADAGRVLQSFSSSGLNSLCTDSSCGNDV